jgi:hypothetical protein
LCLSCEEIVLRSVQQFILIQILLCIVLFEEKDGVLSGSGFILVGFVHKIMVQGLPRGHLSRNMGFLEESGMS